jgi:hypothetical protein
MFIRFLDKKDIIIHTVHSYIAFIQPFSLHSFILHRTWRWLFVVTKPAILIHFMMVMVTTCQPQDPSWCGALGGSDDVAAADGATLLKVQ